MSDCFDHAADAYDDLCFGRTYDGDYEPWQPRRYSNFVPARRTCKFCGMTDLYWKQIDEKWKLCKDGKAHDCKPIY